VERCLFLTRGARSTSRSCSLRWDCTSFAKTHNSTGSCASAATGVATACACFSSLTIQFSKTDKALGLPNGFADLQRNRRWAA
jgi:hypothetical protein